MIFPIGDDQVKGGYFPFFSYGLILVNVVIYVFQTQMNPEALDRFIYYFGAIPNNIMDGHSLYTLGSTMFLHAGFMHLLGNMLFLWVFADNIEATIGNFKFFSFYLLGGLAATMTHILLNTHNHIPLVGASGAISAVMGAYLVMFPKSSIKVLILVFVVRLPAFLFLGLWFGLQAYNGVTVLQLVGNASGVAWWAHIGGFIVGLIAGIVARSDMKKADNYNVV